MPRHPPHHPPLCGPLSATASSVAWSGWPPAAGGWPEDGPHESHPKGVGDTESSMTGKARTALKSLFMDTRTRGARPVQVPEEGRSTPPGGRGPCSSGTWSCRSHQDAPGRAPEELLSPGAATCFLPAVDGDDRLCGVRAAEREEILGPSRRQKTLQRRRAQGHRRGPTTWCCSLGGTFSRV